MIPNLVLPRLNTEKKLGSFFGVPPDLSKYVANPFDTNFPFWYPLKSSENIFRGYRNRTFVSFAENFAYVLQKCAVL